MAENNEGGSSKRGSFFGSIKDMIFEEDSAQEALSTSQSPATSQSVLPVVADVAVDETKVAQIVGEMRGSGKPLTDFLQAVGAISDIVPDEGKRFQAVAKTHGINAEVLLRAAKEQYSALARVRDDFSDEIESRGKEIDGHKAEISSIEERIKNLKEQIEDLEGQQKNVLSEMRKKEEVVSAATASFEAVYEAAKKLLDGDVEKIERFLKGGNR